MTDIRLNGHVRLTNRVKCPSFHLVSAWFCFTLILDSESLKVCRNKTIVQIKVHVLGGTSLMFKSSRKNFLK